MVWGGNDVLMNKGQARGLRTTICAVNKDQAILNAAHTFSQHYNNKGALVKSFPDWTYIHMA